MCWLELRSAFRQHGLRRFASGVRRSLDGCMARTRRRTRGDRRLRHRHRLLCITWRRTLTFCGCSRRRRRSVKHAVIVPRVPLRPRTGGQHKRQRAYDTCRSQKVGHNSDWTPNPSIYFRQRSGIWKVSSHLLTCNFSASFEREPYGAYQLGRPKSGALMSVNPLFFLESERPQPPAGSAVPSHIHLARKCGLQSPPPAAMAIPSPR